jgi:SsrA-binding protein
MKVIHQNKKALFDYEILEKIEAGIVLLGPEIKAIRQGKFNIAGSYIKPLLTNGMAEMWWVGSNFHVEEGDPTRTKKLLLHKQEIKKLLGKLSAGKYTLVPIDLHLVRGKAKLTIGLAKRRKKYDKRQKIKERDIEKNLRERFRG